VTRLPRELRRVPLRAALLVDAPDAAVRDAIRAIGTWARAAAAAGLILEVARPTRPSDALGAGDLVRVGKGRGRTLYRVAAVEPGGADVIRLDGIGAARGRHIAITSAPTLAGSLITAEVHGGPALARVRTLRGLQGLLGIVTLVATGRGGTSRPASSDPATPVPANPDPHSVAWGTPGTDANRVVVAGVLVRDGTVLAARRTYPPELAGLWECPGGKVEPAESERDALVRELDEELGIAVRVGDRVGPEFDIGEGYVLHAYLVEWISGIPSPTVHDALRWVRADEVDDLAWLPSDAPLIPHLRAALDPDAAQGRSTLRAP